MTIAVDLGRKATKQTSKNELSNHLESSMSAHQGDEDDDEVRVHLGTGC